MITLDFLDYQIFLRLRDDPLMSLNELSKELGVTYHQIREHIFKMKNSGFLRPDRDIIDPLLGARKQTEVEAMYRPHKLGLNRIHVIFQGIKHPKLLTPLMQLADEHPYTHYKTMVFTPQPSMYYQFDIPPETLELHIDLFEAIRKKQYYDKLIVFPSNETSKSKLNFTYWDQFQQKWLMMIPSKHAKNPLQEYWDQMFQDNPQPLPKEKYTLIPQKTPKLDELDLNLFRELSINAKVSQKELSAYYKKNNSTISKRLKRLTDKHELLAVLYYNRNVFNVNEQLIITGELEDKTLIPYFHTFIQNNYFPFTSNFITNSTQFFWYLSLPHGVFSDILTFLWDKTLSYQILHINFKKSSTYYFYPYNYDLSLHSWKTHQEYIFDEPFKKLFT